MSSTAPRLDWQAILAEASRIVQSYDTRAIAEFFDESAYNDCLTQEKEERRCLP